MKQPHYVFHLSKRLYSESTLQQSFNRTARKRLNIYSSDYIEDSKKFIDKLHSKKDEKKDESPKPSLVPLQKS